MRFPRFSSGSRRPCIASQATQRRDRGHGDVAHPRAREAVAGATGSRFGSGGRHGFRAARAARRTARRSRRRASRRAVDEPRADLRDLAADLRVHRVRRASVAAPFSAGASDTFASPLAKPAAPPCPFELQRVAVGRVDVGELASPANRADTGPTRAATVASSCRRHPLEPLAAGNAVLEHLGVVERRPDDLGRRGDEAIIREFHGPGWARYMLL